MERTERYPGVIISRHTAVETRARVAETISRAGLDVAEFLRLGERDELPTDELRDLWLMHRPVLV